MQGDNKQNDAFLSMQEIDTAKTDANTYIIGKVAGQNYPLGVFFSAVSTKIGTISLIIVPSIFLVVLEICNLIRTNKMEML